MQKTITLVTTAHYPLDDRIFYHFAQTLKMQGYKVFIICSTKEISTNIDGVDIQGFHPGNMSQFEKVSKLIELLNTAKPDISICSEPLAIYAAYKYKKQNKHKITILFDITEWYPSKVNLLGTKGLSKFIRAAKLILFNYYASRLCQGFIFGEQYKSIPYKLLFPQKSGPIVSYFPNLKYIPYKQANVLQNQVTLCYTGKFSNEKGFADFLEVTEKLHFLRPELKIKLLLVGWFANRAEELFYNNFCNRVPSIEIEKHDYLDFHKFLNTIAQADLYFDLRKTDFHNHHCLPIKLFYYLAYGRPVIYSNLKAIRNQLNISEMGVLIEPCNHVEIAQTIISYVDNSHKYLSHCIAARTAAEALYNWANIEKKLTDYINSF